MVINFIVGNDRAKKYYDEILNGQKIISLLTGEKEVVQEYKHTYYTTDYAFIEFDKYIKQYSKFSDGQKIFFILQFLTNNHIEHIYFLSENLDMEFFKILLNCWKDEIIVQYYNEKHIKEIKDLDIKNSTMKFKKIN